MLCNEGHFTTAKSALGTKVPAHHCAVSDISARRFSPINNVLHELKFAS